MIELTAHLTRTTRTPRAVNAPARCIRHRLLLRRHPGYLHLLSVSDGLSHRIHVLLFRANGVDAMRFPSMRTTPGCLGRGQESVGLQPGDRRVSVASLRGRVVRSRNVPQWRARNGSRSRTLWKEATLGEEIGRDVRIMPLMQHSNVAKSATRSEVTNAVTDYYTTGYTK